MRDLVIHSVAEIREILRVTASRHSTLGEVVTELRKYLENLPEKDLVVVNQIMYSGRDRNVQHFEDCKIDRCGTFSKEDLIAALVIRIDSLADYLDRGLELASSVFEIVPETHEPELAAP